MACTTITSITKGCEPNNSGGIYSVAIHDERENVAPFTLGYTADVTAHTISALTATTDYEVFDFNRNTGSLVVSNKTDLLNGSTFFQATITLVFARQSAAKARALTILGEGQRFLNIIVTDANGLRWMVDHAQLTASEDTSGTVKADGSKYTVTFVADMDNRPYTVSDSLYANVTP